MSTSSLVLASVPGPALLGVEGVVVLAGTALGLAGVRVSWKLHADGGTRSPSPGDVELGQAVSDAQGAFVIAASDTPAAREAYCLAQARGAGATYVIAADTTG